MFRRLGLIRNVFGSGPFLRTSLMFLASVGLAIFEYLQFGSCYSGVAFLVLTAAGWLLRKRIMEFGVEYGSRARTILVTYGVTLFLAKSLGASQLIQLCAIALATTVMFNLNLWAFSEAILVDQKLAPEAEESSFRREDTAHNE